MKSAAFALTILASPANAMCMDAVTLMQTLAEKYEEAPVMRGLSASGQMIVLLANDESGTWTLISVSPEGEACGISAGEAFEAHRNRLPPNG